MVFYQDLLLQAHPSWRPFLEVEFQKEYFQELLRKINSINSSIPVYPPAHLWFKALEFFSIEDCKVVILGQDPYHGAGQAHGLAFSVPTGTAFPPSLRNIFKELQNDLNIPVPFSGDLSPWAKQGVLLLNASLTVEDGHAGAHLKWGWEKFTDALIEHLAQRQRELVFILWGKYAQSKKKYIPTEKHFVLEGVHPSPLSAHRGFFGSKPFSKTNQYLEKQGSKAIQWQVDF
ncbi:uracil-DNA glycosylase [Croceimicrobium sp.]|uniref:uracil-DNA glycosylase n=1 Tax=Croceimicrobium sp. TaxID=2828340 RepID=UPI003BAA09AD